MLNKKKWISLCLAAVMLLCCIPVIPVQASDYSGMCGDNLRWELSYRKLTISGTGDMYDYSEENLPPWHPYSNNIAQIKLSEGLTGIGSWAFYGCSAGMPYLVIPSTVERIGSRAFAYIRKDSYADIVFISAPPVIAEDAFKNGEGFTVTAPGWPETACQNYGATQVNWKVGTLYFKQTLFLKQNEPITADKLQLAAKYSSTDIQNYVAKEILIGPYDNSTYGQKTVDITVDGNIIPMQYFVTDGTNHLDLIQVSFNRCPEYPAEEEFDVVVTAGEKVLVEGVDYTVSKSKNQAVGQEAYLTVKGKGDFEGFSKKYVYSVVKRELREPKYNDTNAYFNGLPQFPEFGYWENNVKLTANEDYVCFAENNINPGTGHLRIVGIGGYAGSYATDFKIGKLSYTHHHLQGTYVGQADGTLTEDYYYSENILSPCTYAFSTNGMNVVAESYILHRLYSDETVKTVDTYNRIVGQDDSYKYDFSSVYDEVSDDGGHVYVLEYAWVDSDNAVYAGLAVLVVSSKVKDAKTMNIEALSEDGDFRREYFDAWSEDGNLGLIQWTSSNTRIATIDDGVVTFLKPGTVTITGSYGKLSAKQTMTVEANPLEDATLVYYDSKTGQTDVVYEGFRLEEGKDFTISVTEKDGMVNVTATGCGLFEGTIMRQFDTKYGEPVGHTHVFSAVCAPSCETCDFVKESTHTLASSWKRDADGHWHVCKLCGEKEDYAEHTYTDAETCAVCGSLNLPGDMNNDYEVTDADAVYLLRYTLFPDSYPITRNGDFNNDGSVTDADAVYLLRYTLFPESYPIK